MSDIVISVENVSKRYRIGARKKVQDSLAGTFFDFVKRPVRNLKRLRELSTFDGPGGDFEDTIWALKGVSFDVKRGEVVGVIGRNGSGKSTLLKIISRITEPTKGWGETKGRIGSLLEVGTGFHPELTGRENIYLNGAILGMKKVEIDHKFDEIVDFSGVEKFIDTPVKRYSSGMKVRLAFSVAAHLESEILLVDEVLAVGDVAFQRKCLWKMDNVVKEGRTILFVSHNMAAVGALCHSCIYLDRGEIRSLGSVDSVIREYLSNSKGVEKIPLSQRTDRLGDGSVRATGIQFLDTRTCQPVETVVSGQDVYIEVSYKSDHRSHTPLKRLNIGLGFFTNMGQFLMVLNSEMASRAFETLPPEGRIYCHVPKFPLMSGVFHIKLTLKVRGMLADQVENASLVNVESGDFFGTGIPNDFQRRGVYVDHSWISEVPLD